ncbi:hypothetical protein [Stenotrophomonas phage BUCTxx99]|nr:hypothetical protein [Stenotrophomonas phage BUCTxx99]
MVRYGLRLRVYNRSELQQQPGNKGNRMGKTYRKEKPQYKKAREDDAAHKKVDHDHERTNARRQMREVLQHDWEDDDDVE